MASAASAAAVAAAAAAATAAAARGSSLRGSGSCWTEPEVGQMPSSISQGHSSRRLPTKDVSQSTGTTATTAFPGSLCTPCMLIPDPLVPYSSADGSTGAPANGDDRRKISAQFPAGVKVHEELHDVEQSHRSTDYYVIQEMVKEGCDASKKLQGTTVNSDGFTVGSSWTPSHNALSRNAKGCAIHPASRFCTLLAIARAAFLTLDAVLVPYVMAWDFDAEWAVYLRWLIVGFWTSDMVFNFTTGFIENELVVMRLATIARRYVRSGFLIDFLVVLVDYVDLWIVASGQGSGLQIVRALRFVKITRLVRIVAKLRSGLLERLNAAVLSWLQAQKMLEYATTVSFAAMIIKLLFIIAWLCHVGACVYHVLQESHEGDGVESWADHSSGSIPPYTSALYWSVSTMFSGASFLDPCNSAEALLSMFWLLMGALCVTIITSTLAATLIAAHEKQQELQKKARCLNSYLGQRQTPVLLSVAINSDFQKKLMAPKPLTELDLSPFFQVISPGLRAALREFEYTDSFLGLPLFRMLSAVGKGLIKELAFGAVVRVASDGEEIFAPRQDTEHALLLAKGSATYSYTFAGRAQGLPGLLSTTAMRSRSGANLDSCWIGKSDPVQSGSWVCELALLSSWTTLGQLDAMSSSELVFLSAAHFVKVVTSDPATEAVAAHYALKLEEIFNSSSAAAAFTDLRSAIDCDVVAAQMHTTVRALVSLPILDVARRQQHNFIDLWRPSSVHWSQLEQQVQAGECHLVMGSEGPQSIVRVARVVQLELRNLDGNILVELIQRRNGTILPKFCLPGAKLRGDEPASGVAERLMWEELQLLAPAIRIVGEREVVECEASASFGLRSKYIKTIVTAEFLGRLESEAPCTRVASTTTGVPSQEDVQKSISADSRATFGADVRRVSRLNFFPWISHIDSFQRLFSKPPFDTDGPAHAFAVRRGPTGRHGLSGSCESLEGGSPTPGIPSAPSLWASSKQSVDSAEPPLQEEPRLQHSENVVAVFRWMSKSELENLSSRSAEVVHNDLHSQAKSLTYAQWHRLFAWKLKCGVAL